MFYPMKTGDIEDMAKIAQSPGFDWKIVWDELLKQEQGTMDMRFSNTLLVSLDDIYNHKGIRAPFYKLLVRRVLDYEINRRIGDASRH